MAGPKLQAGFTTASADFLVPILGHDRLARVTRYDRDRRALVPGCAVETRPVFGRLLQPGGRRGFILALRGYRVDLLIPAVVPNQSVFMSSKTISKKGYV